VVAEEGDNQYGDGSGNDTFATAPSGRGLQRRVTPFGIRPNRIFALSNVAHMQTRPARPDRKEVDLRRLPALEGTFYKHMFCG
jgi:hypothetical protein